MKMCSVVFVAVSLSLSLARSLARSLAVCLFKLKLLLDCRFAQSILCSCVLLGVAVAQDVSLIQLCSVVLSCCVTLARWRSQLKLLLSIGLRKTFFVSRKTYFVVFFEVLQLRRISLL